MPASWMSERLLAMAFAKAIMQDVIVGARFVYKVETCLFVVPWTYFSYGYVCSGTLRSDDVFCLDRPLQPISLINALMEHKAELDKHKDSMLSRKRKRTRPMMLVSRASWRPGGVADVHFGPGSQKIGLAVKLSRAPTTGGSVEPPRVGEMQSDGSISAKFK